MIINTVLNISKHITLQFSLYANLFIKKNKKKESTRGLIQIYLDIYSKKIKLRIDIEPKRLTIILINS